MLLGTSDSVDLTIVTSDAEFHCTQVQLVGVTRLVISLDAPSGGCDLPNKIIQIVTDAMGSAGVHPHFK